MLVDSSFVLESHEAEGVVLTSMYYAGTELANMIERVAWGELSQTIMCHCQVVGCMVGQYVEMTRFNHTVVWSVPIVDFDDTWEVEYYQPLGAVSEHGLVCFKEKPWKQLKSRFNHIPTATMLAPLTMRQLRWSWLWSLLVDRTIYQPQDLEKYVSHLLVAAETLDMDAALSVLRRGCFQMNQSGIVKGRLIPITSVNARHETFYLNTVPCQELILFAEWNGQFYPLIGGSWLFVSE